MHPQIEDAWGFTLEDAWGFTLEHVGFTLEHVKTSKGDISGPQA